MDKFILNTSRFLLFILLVFEYLNHLKILHFNLQFTWIGLMITMSAIWITLELAFFWMRQKCNYARYGYLLFIATLGVYIDFFGDILSLYNRYSWYDQTAHFIGGAAGGIIVLEIIKIINDCHKIKLKFSGISFFSWMTAGFLCLLYEIEEYLEDFYTGSHRLGDGFDTANDLMLGIWGALAIITIFWLYYKRKEKNIKLKSMPAKSRLSLKKIGKFKKRQSHFRRLKNGK